MSDAKRQYSKDRTAHLKVRVNTKELARWKKAAGKLGLSRWVREILDRAAEK
jgi:hypothetical protein